MTDDSTRQDSSYNYCGNHPELDHTHCPSSVECAHASGYGSELEATVVAALQPLLRGLLRGCAGEPTQSPSPTQLATACRTAMAALPGHPGRCSCGACAAQPVPAERYLTQLEAQCRIARQALADEHEGNFTRAVQLIAQDAEELMAIVSKW